MKSSLISLFYSTISRNRFSVAIGNAIRYLSLTIVVLHLFPFPESSLFCLGIDNITPNQKVADGETIVSAGRFFELGFFSPTASKNLRYVGVWYKKFPNEKVVWVAKLENPVRDSSGVLMIGIDGNLVIADGKNNTIWSSNVTFPSNHTVAVLSDFGNLVLKESESEEVVLWESFKHPTDSLLPGMKIGVNTQTGEQINLKSWKDDKLLVDPQEKPQGFKTDASANVSRSWRWSGKDITGMPNKIRDYRAICLKNCSCLACIYVNGVSCMLWLEDLVIDLQEFPYYGDLISQRIPSGGQELHFIRSAYTDYEIGGDSKCKMMTIIIIIIAVVSLVIIMNFVAYILCRRRDRERGKQRSTIFFNEELTTLLVPSFSLQSIEDATNKFCATNKLGEGGFGPVYKGIMSDGQVIAVKRLSRSSGQGNEEFKNEVLLISKLQHRSLVKLLGFCIQGEETLLVYEYMPNKSLDKLIFASGSIEKEVPNWDLRFKIIEGIARGLLYLHRDSRLKIIHRDLKASNILLDEHMNPKISDFGMARIFGGDQSVANTNRVVGTYGYMSPEYAMQGIFSEKSDVFSFGVLLLEVVSGKRNNAIYNHEENPQTLLAYAWLLWNEGKSFELLDPRLNNSNNPAQVNRCIHVALLCVQQNAKDRPTMSAVVNMLCNEMTDLTSPDRPAFSLNDRVDESSNPSSTKSFTCSRNDCSITNVVGR